MLASFRRFAEGNNAIKLFHCRILCTDIFVIIIVLLLDCQVETMNEDMEFVEDVLQLPQAWELQKKIIDTNNKFRKLDISRSIKLPSNGLAAHPSFYNHTYEEYMSQLSDVEMEMLYNVYQHDFILFDYDPCEGL